jgi:hypothetical protein
MKRASIVPAESDFTNPFEEDEEDDIWRSTKSKVVAKTREPKLRE